MNLPDTFNPATALAEAADRFERSIHDIHLVADRMRARMTEQARRYWLRRDLERMFR